MIRGAIFDADGTLLDSMPVWNTLGNDYLLSLGIEPRENLAKTFQTFTMQQSAKYYQDVYGVALSAEKIIAGINERIASFYRERVTLKPGAEAFLKRLKENNVKMCIATATDRHLIAAALERCGVASCFSEIFTCSGVGAGKEKPDIYRAALTHLGTKKEDTWVFEDALHAAMTAAEDGFPVVGIYDSSEQKPEELKRISRIYLDHFPDYPDFWQQIANT